MTVILGTYLPDMSDDALQNILQQAVEFAPFWVGGGG